MSLTILRGNYSSKGKTSRRIHNKKCFQNQSYALLKISSSRFQRLSNLCLLRSKCFLKILFAKKTKSNKCWEISTEEPSKFIMRIMTLKSNCKVRINNCRMRKMILRDSISKSKSSNNIKVAFLTQKTLCYSVQQIRTNHNFKLCCKICIWPNSISLTLQS